MSPFLLIVQGALLIAGMLWLKKQPAQKRGIAAFKLIILALVVVLVVLTVTGRIHWVGALFAGILYLLKKYSFVIRALPFLRSFLKQKNQSQQSTQEQTSSVQQHQMIRAEALQILGLEEGCSAEDIIQAHRKLMQKVHPDHGGNGYLASQLNEARALLLKK